MIADVDDARERRPVPAPAATLRVDGVPVHVDGTGDRTVLMIHGWPDTHRLWDDGVSRLAGRMRCVRFTLPGFEPGAPRSAPGLDAIVALVDAVAEAVSPGAPVDLLVHDWGCAYGYTWAMRSPWRVRRMVGVDIGDAGSPEHRRSLRAVHKAAIASYQLWLALAWRIGGSAGDAMTRRMARTMRAPGDASGIGAAMNHPYHMTWTGRYGAYSRLMRAFEPPRPMLYLYGTRKPFMFHSPEWAASLERSGEHRAVGLRAGHWVMRDRPDEFWQEVAGWLGGER